MPMNEIVIKFGYGARADGISPVQNTETLGEASGKRQFLFDKQHRDPLFLDQAQNDIADLVDDVRLNTFGGFIENQEFRIDGQRATDDERFVAGHRTDCPPTFVDLPSATSSTAPLSRSITIVR